MTFSTASKARLTRHDLDRFGGSTLFDRVGRAVCVAGCLPRKELYEAWEVARRARRLFRGGRVVDLAAGHGLLAHLMLLLDKASSSALVVEPNRPPSSARIHEALRASWPWLGHALTFLDDPLESVPLTASDVVVSCHACGALSDLVLGRASAARARIALLPCCQDFDTCEAGPIAGWVERAAAIDIMRAVELERAGYRVWTQTIPDSITPQNRLLMGEPRDPRS